MDDAAVFILPEKTIAALEKAATSKSAVEARKAI
jgi:hypothetical protein